MILLLAVSDPCATMSRIMQVDANKEYLTIRAASDQTGLSVNTIRWWVDQKGIGARIA